MSQVSAWCMSGGDRRAGTRWHPLPGPRRHVELGRPPRHRCPDLLLPVRARARHGAGPGVPRLLQPDHGHLQDPAGQPHGDRPVRGGAVPRAVREHLVTAIDETGSLKAGSTVQPDNQDRLVIESPRTRRKRPSQSGRGTNFEMYAWIFMRLSGLLLVFLVLGHLVIMLLLDGGVQRINFAFVAGRWASPFWQTWDLLQLWLAQLHGTNGLRW